MIGYLSGTIKFLFGDGCILDVHGVGYKIFLDASTKQNLTVGEAAEFFIHTAVREDAITLFGFADASTLEFFELLLTVSGVGAKTAQGVVSKISAAEFARAVTMQDAKALTRLPGLGKKSAERILLELKDKVRDLDLGISGQGIANASNEFDEAATALDALGYTQAEISEAFAQAPPNSTTEQLIKFALRRLNQFA
ncbi:MAG: Holliday junction branch migration protein RuvA [Selenomonadaceae bacterium]|nr:Holliday junction branch migration protein RuvA [Selenomonadaceae bacterium]